MPETLTKNPAHILIIKLGAFGDVIISQNWIRKIRLDHPQARLTVLTTPPFAEIMRRNPSTDHVIITRRAHRLFFWKNLRTQIALRSLKPDYIYDLQGNKRSRMYCRLIGRQATYDADLNKLTGEDGPHSGTVDLDWLGEPVDDLLAEHGATGRIILLVPGCSARNAYKRWPHYSELARRLSDAGHTCVTAPGPDEISTCKEVPAAMLMNRIQGQDPTPLSIPQLAGLAKRAHYVIGNDTGPTHLCAFMGTPGVAIFGPFTSPAQVGIDRLWPIIETDDLNTLSVQSVYDHVCAHLPTS